MISRSFVRTMPVSFARPDWLVYTVRAFEFSAIMHAAAVLWHLLAAVAGTTGISPGSRCSICWTPRVRDLRAGVAHGPQGAAGEAR